jgi:ABC-type uncharacterized transport system permease subunit
MGQHATILFVLAVIAYSMATTFFVVELRRKDPSEFASRWALRALYAGAVFQAGNIVVASLVLNICPVASVQFGLNFAGLILAAMYLVLRSRARIHGLGAAVAPAVLLMLLVSQFVFEGTGSPHVQGSILALHVTVNVLGIAFFFLAGIASVAYLVQDRRLRNKQWAVTGSRLPSLDALDTVESRLLSAGFVLLTVGILTAVSLPNPMAADLIQQIRALIAYVTWAVVGLVLLMRFVAGWRGRRAAYGTLIAVVGMVAVIVVYAFGAGGGGVL